MVGVITAADAAAARTVLGVDASGTQVSTDVSLTTVTDNYLTLTDQEITAGTVPVSLGGTGSTTAPMVGVITAADAAAARTVLGLSTVASSGSYNDLGDILSEGTGISIDGNNTISTTFTDTNTTYSISPELPPTGDGVIFRLSDNNSGTDDIKFQPSGSTSITRYDANTIEISSTNYGAGNGISLSSNNFNLDYLGLQDLSATDGSFIVGDGSNLINESGSTARASLGVLSGTVTWSDKTSGSGATATFSVTGISSSSVVTGSIKSGGNNTSIYSVTPGTNEITFTLSGTPSSSAVIMYIVIN